MAETTFGKISFGGIFWTLARIQDAQGEQIIAFDAVGRSVGDGNHQAAVFGRGEHVYLFFYAAAG